MQYIHRLKNSIYFNIFCYTWVSIFSYLAFLPYKLSHFAWIAPFGFFLLGIKYRGNLKQLFYQGVIAGSGITIFSYFWMNHLFVVFGGFPFIISFLIFLLYALFTNLRYGVYLVLFEYLRIKSKVSRSLLAAFCILVSEFSTFQIFPYFIGNFLAGDLYLSQIIEFVGVYGLSSITYFVSYSLFSILSHFHFKNKLFYLYKLFPSVLVILFSYALGIALFYKWSSYPITTQKKIMMIQPNAPLEFRDGRSISETIEELMIRIEALAISGGENIPPDLIVLPESGVPFFSANNTLATNIFHRTYNERFESLIVLLANRFKSNVYFNELDSVFKNNEVKRENQRFYNSSSLYDANGNRKTGYQKVYLLAFGEYIPFGEIFPFLYELIPQVGHFLKGDKLNLVPYYENISNPKQIEKSHLRWIDSSIMNLKSIKEYYKDYYVDTKEAGSFLPLICYEVILPEFVRKFKDSGNPDFIVNITNDKWYGKSIETFQHLELARLRSIEYRRWMVRSTNSGTSVFIDHLGRVVNNNYSAQEKEAVLTAHIDIIRSQPTFYVVYGDIIPWAFLLVMIGYIYINKRKK